MDSSYMGKFLVIDLDAGTTATLPLSEELKTSFIGGKDFAQNFSMILSPRVPIRFSPENVLMFLTGPLTATSAPSMRGVVATKSPLTGTYLDSFFGGHFAPSIKYAGYDGIIIKGKARELCYIAIQDDTVAIKPAASMQGLGTLTTLEAVKAELGDPGFKVVSIGPGRRKRRTLLSYWM